MPQMSVRPAAALAVAALLPLIAVAAPLARSPAHLAAQTGRAVQAYRTGAGPAGARGTGAHPARARVAGARVAAGTPGHDVIVQMFGWPWASIGPECANVLGPDGYAAVQISPPEEAVVLPSAGYPWWQAYQPVSYQLGSRFGTRAQLAAMIQACHTAGVKVYADVVLNHMTGQGGGGTGDDGSTFPDKYDYPPLYRPATSTAARPRSATGTTRARCGTASWTGWPTWTPARLPCRLRRRVTSTR